MPKVLNKRDIGRFKPIPDNTVYVGRPSKWGNPFKIGMAYQGRILTRQDTIDAYKDWLLYSDNGNRMICDIDELRGKNLVCWCAPLSCHADLLLELANKEND